MFQMEPATEKDILLNYVYYNDNLRSAVSEWVEFPSQGVLKYKQRDPHYLQLSLSGVDVSYSLQER